MRRHHQEQLEAAAREEREKKEEEELDQLLALVPTRQGQLPHSHQSRSLSPSSSDESSPGRNRRHRRQLVRASDEVEVLPDRFDRHGRPLDGWRDRDDGQWITRRGEFERQPRHRGDFDIKGGWQVAGTNRQAIDGIVRSVTSALEGQKGWLGAIGNVLAEFHDSQTNAVMEDEDEDHRSHRRHRRRPRRLTN